ncbi:beta-induced protein ig-h3 [Seminavis robusta]|uniref:Beta-induced protein ig-h3 n=1 Tax=Seminavis robusta TaxID=568900 RepID=A0A9N8ELB6_9STRA|nr:beta-induced protein ig-h3 [Seminavis robusta]|eukprot:Sro1169_g248630.1 beta-induced protein ig-h3 (992) ;mRNA; f:18095-22114
MWMLVFVLLAITITSVEGRIRGVRKSVKSGKAQEGRDLQGLPVLVGFGGEPDPARFPLGLCQGDCDYDWHCDEGLVCFQRNKNDVVPGCRGGETFDADTDFCVPATPTTQAPSLPPVASAFEAPTTAPTFAPTFADTDTDTETAAPTFTPTVPDTQSPTQSPTQGPTVAPTDVPTGGTDDPTASPSQTPTESPSIQPSTTPSESPSQAPTYLYLDLNITHGYLPPLVFVGDQVFVNLRPLGLCRGDCDADQDCIDELVCFQRDLLEPVPGCSGEGLASIDYCVKPYSFNASDMTDPPSNTMVPTTPQVTTPPAETNPPVQEDPNLPKLETIGDNPTMALGLCQGDCDTDEDCLDELLCYQRDYQEMVPGCSGRGETSYDYCVSPLGGSYGFAVGEVVACTLDVLSCPDGTTLSRVPPACAFPECPEVEEVVCSMDMRTCPDGSFVGRTAPDCQFDECPNDAVACTMEVIQCEDGSFVGRTGPDCDFDICPETVPIQCGTEMFSCPDGTLVGRSEPDCAFDPCPGGAVIIVSGEDELTNTLTISVVQIVLGSTIHTTLVSLIAQAILVGTLNNEGPFTLFAPTDTAFILNGIDDKYTTADYSQHLMNILTYHVAYGKITSSDLTLGPIMMLNGEEAQITSLSPPMINDAHIVTPFDIEGNNGVIHSLDSVLKPSCVTDSIVDIVSQDQSFSILYTMITAADLIGTLQDQGSTFTLFAPTNDAFGMLSADTVSYLTSPEGKAELVEILLYHVTVGNLYESTLDEGDILMVSGDTATIMLGPPIMINDAIVSGDQILASNGVIYPINNVILPPEEPGDNPLEEDVTTPPVTTVPVTAAPVTAQPVSAAPVTAAPITAPPVSAAPITAPPVTAAPVTGVPLTAAPVTPIPAPMPTLPPASTTYPPAVVVVVVGAQEAPGYTEERPQLMVMDSKDEKNNNGGNGGLGLCQGSCKKNSDCAPGLFCFSTDSEDDITEIPGCSGRPDIGEDYCIRLPN